MKSNNKGFNTASSFFAGIFLNDNLYYILLILLALLFTSFFLLYRKKKIREKERELVLRRSRFKGQISGMKNRSKKSDDVKWLKDKLEDDSKIDRILK
ncbi:MAG: hypothetical protein Kow0019_04740 [Methanobacteriaceae archaeon]